MKDSRDAHFEVSLREFDLFSTKILFFISMIIESEIKYCERSMFLSFLQDRISCKSKQIVPYNFTFLLTILLLMN